MSLLLPQPTWRDGPGPPRRPRSRLWRHVLGPRAGFSTFDLGGCNCGNCAPCALPATNLVLSWSMSCTVSGVTTTKTGTATVVYQGVVAGVPTWQTACTPSGQASPCSESFQFTIQCDPVNGTLYQFETWGSSTTCAGTLNAYYTCNATTGASSGLTIGSSTCSPLSITFGGSVWGGSVLTP